MCACFWSDLEFVFVDVHFLVAQSVIGGILDIAIAIASCTYISALCLCLCVLIAHPVLSVGAVKIFVTSFVGPPTSKSPNYESVMCAVNQRPI